MSKHKFLCNVLVYLRETSHHNVIAVSKGTVTSSSIIKKGQDGVSLVRHAIVRDVLCQLVVVQRNPLLLGWSMVDQRSTMLPSFVAWWYVAGDGV